MVPKALHTTWVLALLVANAAALCVRVEGVGGKSTIMVLWGLDLSCLEKLKKLKKKKTT